MKKIGLHKGFIFFATLIILSSCITDKRISKDLISLKEGTDIYIMPEVFPEFKYGEDSLKSILQKLEIPRNETNLERKKFIVLSLIIKENGTVAQDSISIKEQIMSDDYIAKIKSFKSLMLDWNPGLVNKKPVKAEINLPVNIK